MKYLYIFCTILYIFGISQAFASSQIDDAYELVEWAYQEKLTKFSDPLDFHPDSNISRQEFSKFIIQWIKNSNEMYPAFSSLSGSRRDYIDYNSIDESLKDSVNLVSIYGLFQGNNGSFYPHGNLSYYEFHTILSRIEEKSQQDILKFSGNTSDLGTGEKSRDMKISRIEVLKTLHEISKSQRQENIEKINERYRAIWNENKPSKYEVKITNSCFCIPLPTITYTISGGIIQESSIRQSTGSSSSMIRYTGEEFFDMIETKNQNNPDDMRIRYNELLGYPENIYILYNLMLPDAMDSYSISIKAIQE